MAKMLLHVNVGIELKMPPGQPEQGITKIASAEEKDNVEEMTRKTLKYRILTLSPRDFKLEIRHCQLCGAHARIICTAFLSYSPARSALAASMAVP